MLIWLFDQIAPRDSLSASRLRSLNASSKIVSPSPRYGAPQKLDKKRFASKTKFSPRKPLKSPKTTKGKGPIYVTNPEVARGHF